jgi:hypothetical protein
MRALTRWGVAGLCVAVCGLALVGGRGRAGEDDKKIRADIEKIAALEAKGDKAGAAAQAKAVAKGLEDIGDAMHLMKPRNKGGFGIGPKADELKIDGIELYVMAASQDGISADMMGKHAKAFEQMAYRVAAIMNIAIHKEPEKDEGTKTVKLWRESVQQSHDEALKLAKAARAKNAEAATAAVKRLNAGCSACHAEFR